MIKVSYFGQNHSSRSINEGLQYKTFSGNIGYSVLHSLNKSITARILAAKTLASTEWSRQRFKNQNLIEIKASRPPSCLQEIKTPSPSPSAAPENRSQGEQPRSSKCHNISNRSSDGSTFLKNLRSNTAKPGERCRRRRGDERNEREKCFQEPTRNLDLEPAPRLPSPRWNPGDRKPPLFSYPSVPRSPSPPSSPSSILKRRAEEGNNNANEAQRRTRRRIAFESRSGEGVPYYPLIYTSRITILTVTFLSVRLIEQLRLIL